MHQPWLSKEELQTIEGRVRSAFVPLDGELKIFNQINSHGLGDLTAKLLVIEQHWMKFNCRSQNLQGAEIVEEHFNW